MHAFAAIVVVLTLVARPVFAIPLPSVGGGKLDLLARTNLAPGLAEVLNLHERSSEDALLLGRMHSRDFRRPVSAYVEPQARSIIFSREDLPRRSIFAEEVLLRRAPEPSVFVRAHPRDFSRIHEARMEEAREIAEIARAIIEPVLYAREHARDFHNELPSRSVGENTAIAEVPHPQPAKTHPRDFRVPTVTKKSASAQQGATLSRKYSVQQRSSDGPQCVAKRRLSLN
ncbi:unnamed protein product [Somion occarium]|uniref:Uncharacterized protein n=1 Tax=Somion occarium TaxID=3059160 RepID=A0ABP1D5Z8_9APHY